MVPFQYPTTPQIWKSRHEWLSHTQMYVRSKQHEKSPYNRIISQQFSMLWRSLWKSHVATVSRTKASLCQPSVSQNHPHPFSKRHHCCYCVGLTSGQQKETKQKRQWSHAVTHPHALTVKVPAASSRQSQEGLEPSCFSTLPRFRSATMVLTRLL